MSAAMYCYWCHTYVARSAVLHVTKVNMFCIMNVYIVFPTNKKETKETVVLCCSKLCSYIAQYPVLGLFKALYMSPPGRPVHSNTNSTSLGSIQPCCSYCIKTVRSHIHHCL